MDVDLVLPFPYKSLLTKKLSLISEPFCKSNMEVHPSLQKLSQVLDLEHSCGYIAMLNPSVTNTSRTSSLPRPGTESLLAGLGDSLLGSPIVVVSEPETPSSHNSSFDLNVEDDSMDCRSSDDVVVIGKDKRKAVDESALWVPLELCYGVPLFEGELGKMVTQKVSRALCTIDIDDVTWASLRNLVTIP